jgi:hypothetical protein
MKEGGMASAMSDGPDIGGFGGRTIKNNMR